MTRLRKTLVSCLMAMSVAFAACTNVREPASGPGQEQKVNLSDTESPEVKKNIPVHPWHKERVENIRAETTRKVIEHLANFDDAHLAETASAGMLFQPGRMKCEVVRVVHLSRVRRLLEEGRESPQLVVPLLRAAYKDALAAWPKARAERIEAERKAGGNLIWSEPDAFDKVNTKAVATTYLLAEL